MSNEKEGLGATLKVPVSKTTFTTKSGASFTINYYSIGDVRKVFREEFPISNCSINFERNANGDLVLIGVLSYNYQKDSSNEIQLTMLVPQTINDTKEGNVLITFMEKRLKVMALGLPDPEEQIEEEKSYNNTKEQETKTVNSNSKPATEKQINAVKMILEKIVGLDSEDYDLIKEHILKVKHLSELTIQQVNDFFKLLSEILKVEKFSLKDDFVESNFETLKNGLLEAVVRHQNLLEMANKLDPKKVLYGEVN